MIENGALRVGVATVDITPPIGSDLTGFLAREGPSVGVRDPVYARALILDDEQTQVALITCDLLGLDAASVATMRRAIEQATGVAAAHVMIAASHTHSGPASIFLRHCGAIDPGWMADLPRHFVQVAQAALTSARPARLTAGAVAVEGVSANRRQPDGPIDRELGIIRVDDAADGPIAVLFSFACHPVTPGARNRLISADFPGVLARVIAEQTAATVLFANGACGDINPASLVNVPIDRHGSFDLVDEIGRTLADAALAAWSNLAPAGTGNLRVANRVLDLPLQPLPSVDQLDELGARYRAEMEQAARDAAGGRYRVAAAMLDWVEATMAARRSGGLRERVAAEIQVITLGDVALVGVPGELFAALGLAIKQCSPLPHTHVLTYTNGNLGYIPTRAAYAQGGYEVDTAYRYYGYPAPLAPEAGEMVVATALELIRAAAER